MTQTRQLRYWLIGFLAFAVLLYLLRGVLLPFVAGMAIAYFFDPAADRLEKWGCSRTVATSIITLLFLVLVAAFIFFLFPLLQRQIGDLVARLPVLGAFLWDQAEALLAKAQTELPPEQAERLRGELARFAGDLIGKLGHVLGTLWSGGLALFNLISLVVITPIVTFYLLRDWDRMMSRIDTWLPREHAETIRDLLRQIDRTLSGFVRGQALVCFILGAFYAVALTVVGLDFSLVVGLGAGLISFVPYLGAMIGFVVSIGLALIQFTDWVDIALVAVIFVVGQAAEGNILQPKLVGDRVGLHPVWIIFALLAGGALLGFVGLLLAIPIAAAIGVLVRFGLDQYLKSPLYDRGGPGDQAPPGGGPAS